MRKRTLSYGASNLQYDTSNVMYLEDSVEEQVEEEEEEKEEEEGQEGKDPVASAPTMVGKKKTNKSPVLEEGKAVVGKFIVVEWEWVCVTVKMVMFCG